jgi:hypothetical protein
MLPGVAAYSPLVVPLRPWPTSVLDPCGGPTGERTFYYVLCCAPCAAGDVAAAGGRSYACSCCAASTLFCPCAPCVYAGDRQALAARLNVHDDVGCLRAGALFYACGGCCLLAQEVALLKESGWYALRGLPTAQTFAAPALKSIVSQQMMYQVPGGKSQVVDNDNAFV